MKDSNQYKRRDSMNYSTTEVCLIAIATCTVLMTLIGIILMFRLFKTLKKVETVSSEIQERVNQSNKGLGYIAQAVQTGFDLFEVWKEKKNK